MNAGLTVGAAHEETPPAVSTRVLPMGPSRRVLEPSRPTEKKKSRSGAKTLKTPARYTMAPKPML
jgi:hypothetical protein